MARVRDLWHKARPGDDEPLCGDRAHHQKATRAVATPRHGRGKRWQAEYADPGGKVRTQAFDRKPDAEAYLDSAKVDVRRGDWINPDLAMTKVAAVIDTWISTLDVEPQTLERYERVAKAFKGEYGDQPVGPVAAKPSALEAWLNKRTTPKGARLAEATRRMYRWIVWSIFELAVDDELIRKNPLRRRRSNKGRSTRRMKVQPWPLATIRGIIEAHPPQLDSIPALGFGAGLRQGEAFGFGKADLDALRRKVHVRQQIIHVSGLGLVFTEPKRGSIREVDVDQELVDFLALHLAAFPPVSVTLPWIGTGHKPGETRTVELLAVTRFGNACTAEYFNKIHWHRALRAVEIEPAGKATGFHQARHAFASYRLAQGCSLTDLQSDLGHRNLSETADTYTHQVPKTPEDRIPDAIASLFRSVPVPPRSASVPSGRGN